ncbi:MXAN_6521/LA_1396 family lipoprotein [Pyxidicoccus parkwayensis]|uniref:MXAN_6521/LA_1396 family lipoprotein n=1 Tax=Pyxidicoccus parkwayensis TaxID=2813578 RepID=A0ABX7NVC7_9BACT|nr:MXAN_6521/LA_1396 family lipoprotein [Pyxidicoccus parkwaysis]QSQ22857.1 MXAN_6521/LA_1396 family lipoprotein [Pyxidicoccus parkwaysis]
MTTKRLWPVLGLGLLCACSTVKSQRLRPDYAQVDKQQVKRLVVVTQPLPDNKPQVGELWSLLARQWVNQNRDFIVKSNVARPDKPEDTSFKGLCEEGMEGVLWLEPSITLKARGEGAEAAVKARLTRCRDGEEVWAAEAAGSWGSKDEDYAQRIEQYVQELGEEVRPYVVPSAKLLSATLDTLPNPQLNDADKDEKIELGE